TPQQSVIGDRALLNGSNGDTQNLAQSPAGATSINGGNASNGAANGDTAHSSTSGGVGTPPFKRRPGRPPRDPVAFYAALSTPATPTVAPLQGQNSREKLMLPHPTFRRTDP